MTKDYYKILGVDKNASKKDIDKAYRDLAKKLHPDVNPNNEQAVKDFKECVAAYEVLGDAEKRKRYDSGGYAGNSYSANTFYDFNPFDIFGDLFSHSFNWKDQKNRPISKEIFITLEESCLGVKKKVDFPVRKECDECKGTGDQSAETCAACHGRGKILTKNGNFAVSMTCHKCRGAGKITLVLCAKCSGLGVIQDTVASFDVEIPQGVEDKTKIYVSPQDRSKVCIIRIKQHPLYVRDMGNLLCFVPITFTQSILGVELDMPLLDGTICKVKIPAGVKSGSVLRVAGKGMPVNLSEYVMNRSKAVKGDLLISIQVEIPATPSDKYLNLIKKLHEVDDEEMYPAIVDFKSKIGEIEKQKKEI